MFCRIRIFLTSFALLTSLFGLSACNKASTPTGANSLGGIQEIPDTDWIKPTYTAAVKNDSGDVTWVTVTYNKATAHDPIIFKPKSGLFEDIQSVTTLNVFEQVFQPDITHIMPMTDQSMFESHTYLNGKLTVSDNGGTSWYDITTRIVEDTKHDNQLHAGDSWYVVYVFKGADGQMYKFTTPTMTVADGPTA